MGQHAWLDFQVAGLAFEHAHVAIVDTKARKPRRDLPRRELLDIEMMLPGAGQNAGHDFAIGRTNF